MPGCSWNGASKQYTSTDFCKSFVVEFEYQEAVTFLFLHDFCFEDAFAFSSHSRSFLSSASADFSNR